MSVELHEMSIINENFFKDAFCVDGKVKMLSPVENHKFGIIAIMELNDSERGTFYVGYLYEKKGVE